MVPLRIQQEIMDLVVEDYTPLFDVTAVIRTRMPERTPAQHVHLAREFVEHLLRRGYVNLYYDCAAKSTENHRHVVEVAAGKVHVELRHQDNWIYHDRRGSDQQWVAVGATSAGESALHGGEFSE